MNMKKRLAAFAVAFAVTTTTIPMFTTGVYAVTGDLHSVITDYAQTFAADNQEFTWNANDSVIENVGDIEVASDMKARQNGTTAWQDKVANCTVAAGTTLNRRTVFDYKTTVSMSSVLSAVGRFSSLVDSVLKIETNQLGNNPDIQKYNEFSEQLENSYVEGAEFTITINNPNGMTIPASALNGTDMYGFEATNGSDTISPVNGTITIPGDPTDAANGNLVYKEVNRTRSGNNLVITVATEGKTTKKALEEALKYDLVLTCMQVEATGPSSYSTTNTYKLVGTVTGNTPIYTPDEPAAPIADITYKAVQDTSSASLYDTASEISASVAIRTSSGGGGGGGGTVGPIGPTVTPTPTPGVTPTPAPTIDPNATPSPTFAPDEIVPAPEIFNSADHYAYIIGYPEGDVRPENNISREEVATIFYRLLTEESREKMMAHTNDLQDVNSDRWSNNAISTMENGGYVTGYEDGTFKPGAPITRAEFVTLATRFYGDVVAADAAFRDVSNHWAKQFIDKAVFYRLINGYDDDTFRPEQHITRAEVMRIVNTILNRHVTVDGLLPEAIANNWSDNSADAWYYTDVFEATMTHDFTRAEGTLPETWTALKENPDWASLEKAWTE